MIGDALRAKESATLLRDENVILDADAAEVLIRLELVEVDELLAVSAGFPVVDERRDEIDAGLVGKHETFLQLAAHTQTVGAELFEVRACLLVEAHVYLSQSLHVVYIHTHHVSQTVRQEHRVGTSLHGLVRVALHQSELLQAIRHLAAHGEVYIHIFHTRLCHVEHIVVTLFHDRIDLQLPLRELSVHRHCAGVV